MVPATMLPAASSLVRSTADLMNTKLLPQKMATLKSSRSATSALRREVWTMVAGRRHRQSYRRFSPHAAGRPPGSARRAALAPTR